ncbi:MAG: HEAT repeat domain-containing protein, partial [Treponema sp.]|nr:HEAT repeat domain-containing protein [Treponema sp.]
AEAGLAGLEGDLIALAQKTRNRAILTGLFSFFGSRVQGGLEERALLALEEWDREDTATVLAAIDYLGKLKAGSAAPVLRALIDAGEARFTNAAIRALGRIGGALAGEAAADIAVYLINYYETRYPGDETRREILLALGDVRDPGAVLFLAEIASDSGVGLGIGTAALEALAGIGDERGLEAVLAALSSTNPNLRSAAVAALGPFNGPAVDDAILEAFRDAYYRTRIAAAQAAGQRKLSAAVPYLGYRAEHDEVAAVREEAVRALGAIATGEARAILERILLDRKNTERIRILAADMLVLDGGAPYAGKLIAELEWAKTSNLTNLYNGLLKAASTLVSPEMEALAGRLLAGGNVVEKSYALDMVANNRFMSLIEAVRTLTDPKNGSLAPKAQATLEKLGVS